MTISAIIFDVDGTLLDSMPVWYGLFCRFLQKRGIEPEAGLQDKLFALSLQQGAEYLQQTYRLPETPAQILSAFDRMVQDSYQHHLPLKPGISELLPALQNRRLTQLVASASQLSWIEAALDRTGVSGYFQAIYTCPEMRLHKDDPRFFQAILREHGLSPEQTLVVEDALYAICTARAAGMPTAAFFDPTSETQWPEICQTADFAYRTPLELLTCPLLPKA